MPGTDERTHRHGAPQTASWSGARTPPARGSRRRAGDHSTRSARVSASGTSSTSGVRDAGTLAAHHREPLGLPARAAKSGRSRPRRSASCLDVELAMPQAGQELVTGGIDLGGAQPASGPRPARRCSPRSRATTASADTVPCAHGSSASHASACLRVAPGDRRSVVAVVLAAAGTADHDLVLLDRDLDRAVPRPVLGVDRVVLDGGIEPQAVALLAVVERALERAVGGGAAARAAAAAAGGRLGFSSSCVVLPASAARRVSPRPRPPCARPPRRRGRSSSALRAASSSSSAAICASSSARRSTSSSGAPVVVGVGLQALLALERLDLLDGHFELVRDPRVGATLSHPPADLVKLRTQGPAAHRRAGD